MATFVHCRRGVIPLALPCSPALSKAGALRFLRLPFGFTCILALTIGCGSSTSTSVAAPSSPSSARCQANVSSSVPKFASAGGTGTVSITVDRDCPWNAASQSGWITITSAASGQGDGTVGFRVSVNNDPVARDGVIAVSDRQIAVGQEAAPCRYDVTPNTNTVPPQGGEMGIAVRAHSACSWAAKSEVTWATVSPDSGRGDATLRVVVSANSGPARTLWVAVAGTSVTATQSAASTPSPSPAPAPPAPAPPAPAPPPPAPAPAPVPPPPPPSPVPVPVKPIDLSGKAGAISGTCPLITFNLKDRAIYTTALTEFRRISCDQIKKDTDLSVQGWEMSDQRIRADQVTKK
jgi:Viral BACON domain/Putative binding domain, N-terminal